VRNSNNSNNNNNNNNTTTNMVAVLPFEECETRPEICFE
jgi:hypothetical protein